MYHIADIKKMERCPRSFWLSRRVKKEFIPFINYNENMLELVKVKLHITDCFEGHPNDDPSLAMQAFQEGKVLVNARFAFGDMRIKIPVLRRVKDKIKVYFTYKSCYPKEHEIQYIADHITVLELQGIVVDEVCVIHLNAAYVRQGEVNVEKLLVINKYLYNAKNHAHKRIMDMLPHKKRDIVGLIARLDALEGEEEIPVVRTTQCTRGSKCPYYDDCFPDKPGNNSITNLVQSAHKYDMLEEGRTQLHEVDVERMEGTRHQYAQVMAAKQGGLYIDKVAMRCWRESHITYPISYLDFEWETFAFPPYQGMKPFDVLTFQYSLHIESEKGQPLQHVGYIGEGDCRIAFVEDLLQHIPKQGSILVYNMEGAEKLRLVGLAQQFPQYEKALRQVWERMIDLSLPFSTGNVYDIRMAGFFSLKTLVPIFSTYNYQDLDITYGMDAVQSWRTYCETSGPEKTVLYDQLVQYCSMDTYAEYIVYHALEELMDQK